MPPERPGRGADQFPLRLPDGMRQKIRAAADANARSMNSEILDRLDASFDPEPMSQEHADAIAALHQSESTREILGKFIEAQASQIEALIKAGVSAEQIVFMLVSAIMKAADGDSSELEKLVEREKSKPVLHRLKTVYSAIGDG
jgi:plasmid stability protein